jgi:hypothetical protein
LHYLEEDNHSEAIAIEGGYYSMKEAQEQAIAG